MKSYFIILYFIISVISCDIEIANNNYSFVKLIRDNEYLATHTENPYLKYDNLENSTKSIDPNVRSEWLENNKEYDNIYGNPKNEIQNIYGITESDELKNTRRNASIQNIKFSSFYSPKTKKKIIEALQNITLLNLHYETKFVPDENPKDRIHQDAYTTFRNRQKDKQEQKFNRRNLQETIGNFSHVYPLGCISTGEDRVECTGENITEVPSFNKSMSFDFLRFYKTKIIGIDDDQALRIPNSKILSFSKGILSKVKPSSLQMVEGLEELILSYNHLDTWTFSGFNSMNNRIKIIDLQGNYIRYPPNPFVHKKKIKSNLVHLETLILSHNPLSVIPSKLFQPISSSPLKNLFMNNCSIKDIGSVPPLSYTPNLELLDLSDNSLNNDKLRLLLTPLKGKNLTHLYLAYNNYQVVPREALELVSNSLVLLDLHSSVLTCLDKNSFPNLPKLTHLDLSYSRIRSIQKGTFDNFDNIQELQLHNNKLTSVPSAVGSLKSITSLYMKKNPNGDGQDWDCFYFSERSLSNLTALSILSLAEVPLRGIEKEFFTGLTDLNILDLRNCGIQYIQDGTFATLENLSELYLTGNNLVEMSVNAFIGLKNLKVLDLGSNNLSFMKYTPLKSKNPFGKTIDYVPNRNKISQRINFTRPIPRISKRRIYSRYTIRSKHLIEINPFKPLVSLKKLILSNNNIDQFPSNIFETLTDLRILEMSNNRIIEWRKEILHNNTKIEEFYLFHNYFRKLTNEMVIDFRKPNYRVIDLRDNNFECSCTMHYLNKSVILKYDTLKCSEDDRVLSISGYLNITKEMNKPCPLDEMGLGSNNNITEHITLGVIGSIILVIIISGSAFTYYKRWYLRYMAYSIRSKMRKWRRDSPNQSKYEFDTFVCYSNKDRQWVFEQLLYQLEYRAKLRVCVHERDFEAGEEVTNNIVYSIEKSRKVLVVLSRAFVASGWCMFELQMAAYKILDEKKNKLIFILKEPIPENEQPKTLKIFLKIRTYIPWITDVEGQRLFWAKLIRSVSRPTDSENSNMTSMGSRSQSEDAKNILSSVSFDKNISKKKNILRNKNCISVKVSDNDKNVEDCIHKVRDDTDKNVRDYSYRVKDHNDKNVSDCIDKMSINKNLNFFKENKNVRFLNNEITNDRIDLNSNLSISNGTYNTGYVNDSSYL